MSKRVDYKKIKTPQKIVKNQSVNHARRLSMQNRLSVSHRHKKAVSTPIAETLGAVNTKTPWALKKSPALVTAMLTGSHKPGLQGSYNQRSSICASPFRVSPKKHKLSELIPEVKSQSVQNPDWKNSQLEKIILEGCVPIDDILPQNNSSKECIQRGIRIIERLKKELMMEGFPTYKHTAKSIWATCTQLFDVRAVTIDILSLIHHREQLIESILTSDKNQAQGLIISYQYLSSKIGTLISNWRDLNVPFDKFIYNAQDYLEKIEEDSELCLGR